MSFDTVGTLLADIANLLSEGLRTLTQTDSSQWGLDEHEQVRAFQDALNEAKTDFQELSPLVKGQIYYENDRKRKPRLPVTRPIVSFRLRAATHALAVSFFSAFSLTYVPIRPPR